MSNYDADVPPKDRINRDVDLNLLLKSLWEVKWFIGAISFLFAAVAATYSFNQPDLYKAQVLLAPAKTGGSSGLSALASQFGALSGVAGFNLGANDMDLTDLAIEVVQSRKFITNFIKANDLTIPLLAAVGWDQENNSFVLDPNVYDKDSKTWLGKDAKESSSEVLLWKAHKRFKEIFTVYRMKNSPFVKVELEYYSPLFVKHWIDMLVKSVNLTMRERTLAEAQESIKFLKSQLLNTEFSAMQNIFYQLIEEQTKTIMLSEVRDEFVFTTVDPAVRPIEKSGPNRLFNVVAAFCCGALICLFVTILRFFSLN